MRVYPDRPIASVGAVIVDGERVLLIRRGHEPLKGEWSLPGGVVELGETLGEALRREVLEETGLQIQVGPLIDALDRVHRDGGRVEYHFVILDYLCSVSGGELACGSDADDARWVAARDLAEYRLTERAYQVVLKGFEMCSRTE